MHRLAWGLCDRAEFVSVPNMLFHGACGGIVRDTSFAYLPRQPTGWKYPDGLYPATGAQDALREGKHVLLPVWLCMQGRLLVFVVEYI